MESNETLRREWSSSITDALINCSDDPNDNYANRFSNESHYQVLPYFLDERPVFSKLLDYILVNWPYLLEHMIRTQGRRALLRRYANDALRILECALESSATQNYFQLALPSYWSRRAQLFFDSRNLRMRYIDHIYTLDYPVPHTHGDTSQFLDLTSENFEDRNGPASSDEVASVLNTRARDCFGRERNGIFPDPNNYVMRSIEYYFENHLTQFYRVLLFFLELQSRGIRTDEDDIYQGPIPFNIVPEEIQEIVSNDTAYCQYLLSRRRNELGSGDIGNKYQENLSKWADVRTENLIMLFWTRNKYHMRTFNNTTSTTSVPTTASKYDQEYKTGRFCVNSGGKHFRKGIKTFINECCNKGGGNPDTMDSTKFTNGLQNQLGTKDKYFGYIVYNGHLDRALFSVDESKFFEILAGSLVAASG